ncbi:Na+/H+ antiporter NhaA [Helicobacter sp. T3_23-1056]
MPKKSAKNTQANSLDSSLKSNLKSSAESSDMAESNDMSFEEYINQSWGDFAPIKKPKKDTQKPPKKTNQQDTKQDTKSTKISQTKNNETNNTKSTNPAESIESTKPTNAPNAINSQNADELEGLDDLDDFSDNIDRGQDFSRGITPNLSEIEREFGGQDIDEFEDLHEFEESLEGDSSQPKLPYFTSVSRHRFHSAHAINVKDRLKKGLNTFISHESFSGVLLFFCVIFAMGVANSAFAEKYFAFQELKLGVFFGEGHAGMSILHFVNDVAMSFFFLMIGLEMKREILYGELAGAKKVIFPMLAALGGIVVPIGIYLFFNHGTPSAVGFGVAMSTDTAFALGAILFLGKRVPLSLKVFLVTLAVVDDLGAIFVIVIFYTQNLQISWLIIALIILAVLIYFNQQDTRKTSSYLFLGVLLWIAVHNSGIHATIAAVLLAFCIPGRSNVSDIALLRLREELKKITHITQSGRNFFETHAQKEDMGGFRQTLASLKKFFSSKESERTFNIKEQSQRVQILESIAKYSHAAQNPLLQLQTFLHPLCSYFVVPFFAFVNAGVRIDSSINFDLDHIFLGTILGLVVGKPIGILVFSFLGVKLGVATKPNDLSFGHIFATGCLAGIGFTMSIFVANLAYDHEDAIILSKISILYASSLALIIGICLLYFFTKPKEPVYLLESKRDLSDLPSDISSPSGESSAFATPKDNDKAKDFALDLAFAKESAKHHIKDSTSQINLK